MYSNFGGIGVIVNRAQTIVKVVQGSKAPLVLRSAAASIENVTVPAPEDGWTSDTVKETLEQQKDFIQINQPVDVYIDDQFIGSTEM